MIPTISKENFVNRSDKYKPINFEMMQIAGIKTLF